MKTIESKDGGVKLIPEGDRKPLHIPIDEVIDVEGLATALADYIEELPNLFHSTIIMPGSFRSEVG